MKSPKLAFLIMAFGAFLPTDAYRILALYPFCSRSHNMMFDAITESLAKRGHQMDVVTCFPPKKPVPNVNVLFNAINTQEKLVNKWNYSMALSVGSDTLKVITGPYGNDLCHILGVEALQRIAKNPPNDPPYDLVIVEAFGSSCFLGFGPLLNVPVVLVSSTIEFPWIDRALGNPTNTAFFPAFFSEYTHPMNFWVRVKNTLLDLYSIERFHYITGQIQTELMRKYLREDLPHVQELETNAALALINSFHSLTGVRPTTTNLIEVGGIHVENNNAKLTKDIKKWLDESKDGLVYFTLGSMVNIETMPEETVQGLYASFRKIAPVRVLMKVANKDRLLPGLPDNVMTSSWIPQIPVLAHNNTRAFMTHGGLMSTQESLYHGVPLIGIPLFGDQPVNVRYYERKGMAVLLDFDNIDEQTVSRALNKLLNDPSYRKAAKHQSALFRDRPMSATDTAVYWVEYTARNGPNVLKSPAIELAWWQVLLLDVYAFLLVVVVTAVCIVVLLIKFVLETVVSSTKQSTTKGTKRD